MMTDPRDRDIVALCIQCDHREDLPVELFDDPIVCKLAVEDTKILWRSFHGYLILSGANLTGLQNMMLEVLQRECDQPFRAMGVPPCVICDSVKILIQSFPEEWECAWVDAKIDDILA